MVILSLHLGHFGKFENRTIELRPGMNIITGPNSSGKSTIASFIPAMFFGLSEDSEIWEKFLPDHNEDASYEGSMQILYEDSFYRIERSFQKNGSFLKVFSLPENEEVENPEHFMESILEGVSEENFYRYFLASKEQLKVLLCLLTKENLTEEELQKEATLRHIKRATSYLKEKKDSFESELDATLEEKIQILNEEISEKEETEKRLSQGLSSNHAILDREVAIKNTLQAEVEKAKTSLEQNEKELDKISALSKKTEKNRNKKPVAAIVFFSLSVVSILVSFILAYFKITKIYIYDVSMIPSYLIIACILFFLLGFVFLLVSLSKRKRANHFMEREEELHRLLSEAMESTEKETKLSDVELHVSLLVKENEELESERNDVKNDLSGLYEKKNALSLEEERMGKIRGEISAVDIAYDSFLRLVEKSDVEDFSPLILASNEMYQKMNPDNEFMLGVKDDIFVLLKNEEIISLKSVSERASIEAVFSVLLQKVNSENAGCPLILDDVFTGFDESRMNKAMDIIRDMDRQVVLFSCHTRERQAM